MARQLAKQFHVQPTFDSIEQEYDEEQFKDPGPGLARQATEFILSPFTPAAMTKLCSNRVRKNRHWLVCSNQFHQNQLLGLLGQADLKGPGGP